MPVAHRLCEHEGRPPAHVSSPDPISKPRGCASSTTAVGEDRRRGRWRGAGARPGTYPPLLVLLPCDDNHFPLHEGELIVIVRLAVVDGLHSPHLVFPLEDRSGALVGGKDTPTLGVWFNLTEPQFLLCQGGGLSARSPGAVCSLSLPEH